jgi:tetratricopeptide (TPR) repeat protein
MRKVVPALIVAVALVASCATSNQAYEKAPLFGMIYDEDNQPCVGVLLSLDGGAGKEESGPMTDIRGRFVLPEVGRGQHVLVARKDGYEELSLKVTIMNRTDVLFLRMISFSQLLAGAEKAIEERKWDQAEAFLGRAGKLDSGDSVLLYLQAVKAYRTGSYAEAVGHLMNIVEKGTREPSVYLFLADIYEKKLDDKEKAVENLRAYLNVRADSETEKRLSDLMTAQK